jgi:ribosome recycling factor
MTEELAMVLDMAKEAMNKGINHLGSELTKIRAGRATPSMLDGVYVDYYGVNTPLSQVANVNTPDPRTITVQPWERKMLDPIEKAIINSNLGFNPQNNGELIIINVPMLTEERRKNLVKQAKAEAESAKVVIRTARKDANDEIKNLQKDGLSEDIAKDGEDQVQKITNAFNARIDELLAAKEKDIMTV